LDAADGYFTGGDMPRLRVTPSEARRAPIEPGHLSAVLLQHGSMQLRWYAPNDIDPQAPHDRDELYVVVEGAAVFVRADEATPFGEEWRRKAASGSRSSRVMRSLCLPERSIGSRR
jgi:hypothetical protein